MDTNVYTLICVRYTVHNASSNNFKVMTLTQIIVIFYSAFDTAIFKHNPFKRYQNSQYRLKNQWTVPQGGGVLLLFSDAIGLCPFGVGAYR